VVIVLTLVSCSGDSTINQSAETDIPQTTAGLPGAESGQYPVAVSYIDETDQETQIISTALNFKADYSPIPVDTTVEFRGPAAVDEQNNLFLVYGSSENRISKLGVNGEVETIELPYQGPFQSLWAGVKLFILPIENSMAVVDTNLQITTLTPAINILDDGTTDSGKLGITTKNDIIWAASTPIKTETGDYALYRSISLESYEITEQRLQIPVSDWNWYQEDSPNPGPNDRLGTVIHAIDPQRERVLLCYQYMGEDRVIYSTLELYNTSDHASINSIECCCINNLFELRGDSIIENSFPEACGATRVFNLYDLQPSFDVAPYLSIQSPLNNWVSSNGRYWLILSDKEISVFNEDQQFEASYQLPSNLPQVWVPSSTLVPAFLIAKEDNTNTD